MKKLLAVLVAAGLATAAVVTCFPSSPSNAATVDGAAISRTSLNADFAAIAASPGFTCYVNAALVASGSSNTRGIRGSTPTSYNPAFAAYWLTQRIEGLGAGQYAAAHHLTVTAADLAAAKTSFENSISQVLASAASTGGGCSTTAAAIVASMPSSFVDRQVRIQAAFEAVLRAAGNPTTPAAVKAYYDADPSRFDTVCLSAIVNTAEGIDQAVTALRQGMPFAQAVKLYSQSGSNSNGSIGCFEPTSSAYAQVSAIVGSTPIGHYVAPFAASSTLYALLRVDARTTNPFSSVEGSVSSVARSTAQRRSSDRIRAFIAARDVVVNSTYGTWVATASTLGVSPPTSKA